MQQLKDNILERFLRYVQINTQSDPDSTSYPSTACQLQLLSILVEELIEMGADDVEIDPHGYVTATIPATISSHEAVKVPVIGFIAHVDTSSDISGKGVLPQIVNYVEGDIAVNSELNVVIAQNELSRYLGHTLITSDGTTLLGADDKAGVAEIMATVEYLLSNPQIPHGKIRVAFTPDEEVGRGTEYFDVEAFGATYAYTMDGGGEGGIEYETFNAAEAIITVNGVNTHPGYAKGKMVNSQYVAMEIDRRLGYDQRPESSEGREGFFHLTRIIGTTDQTKMHYIIRDHDRTIFEVRKVKLEEIISEMRRLYPEATFNVEITDQYYNMREKIEPVSHIIDYALEAMRLSGVEPIIEIVRGGTDGSRLSFCGLPCPNLFCGAENIHSRKEFVSLDVMTKSALTVLNLCKLFYTKSL